MNKPLILNGLDAGNPLAFLAALGTLRSLSLAWPDADIRLHWGPASGGLRPYLSINPTTDEQALILALIEQLRQLSTNPAITFTNDLSVSHEAFRAAACYAQQHACVNNRIGADFIAAFACDALIDTKTGIVQDTAWRTMSGAGHQHFLGFMQVLTTETTAEQVRDALFTPWRYTDPGPSLRWDPMDDRRYALRWNEPSGDPIRTVRGANALAIQALPLYPTQPRGTTLATTGFSRVPRKGTYFTWPIWEHPLPLDVVRSLLAQRDLQSLDPTPKQLRALGIIEVFRSQRITQGKYRNFTQGGPV